MCRNGGQQNWNCDSRLVGGGGELTPEMAKKWGNSTLPNGGEANDRAFQKDRQSGHKVAYGYA